MQSQAEMLALLRQHIPLDEVEAAHRDAILAFVARTPHYHAQTCLEGHVTASAWVLHPREAKVLLTHHKKLGQWFQLGGHIEGGDVSVQAAALREAQEESGIEHLAFLSEAIFDVDAHRIPESAKGPAHWHFDVRFVFRAEHAQSVLSEESTALAWVPLCEGEPRLQEASMQRMRQKSMRYIEGC